jgi:hypothetical protein
VGGGEKRRSSVDDDDGDIKEVSLLRGAEQEVETFVLMSHSFSPSRSRSQLRASSCGP